MLSGGLCRMAWAQRAFSCAFTTPTDSLPLENPNYCSHYRLTVCALLKRNFHLPVQMWCRHWSLLEQDNGLAQLVIPSEMVWSLLVSWVTNQTKVFSNPSHSSSSHFMLFLLWARVYFNKTVLHKSSEWSNLIIGPGLNSSRPDAKNPRVFHSSETTFQY